MGRVRTVRQATVFVVGVASILAFAVPRTPAYVNPALVPQASVPGIVFDVSTTTLLYLDTRTRQLVLIDRATSLAVTVPRVPGGRTPVNGYLGGGRVIFMAEAANSTDLGVYEWSGTGAPTLLEDQAFIDSLRVAGDYAIWSNRSCWLFRRDLATGATVIVSFNACGGNDVDAAGDVVFWAPRGSPTRSTGTQTARPSS